MKITALFSCCLFLLASGAQDKPRKRSRSVTRRSGTRVVHKGGLAWRYNPDDAILIKAGGYENLMKRMKEEIEKKIVKAKKKGNDITPQAAKALVIKDYSGLKGAVTKNRKQFVEIIQPNLTPYSFQKEDTDSLILLTGSHHYLFDAVKIQQTIKVPVRRNGKLLRTEDVEIERPPTGVTKIKEDKEGKKVIKTFYPRVPLDPKSCITVSEFIKDMNRLKNKDNIVFKGKNIELPIIEEYLKSLTKCPDMTKVRVLREVQRHVTEQERARRVTGSMTKPAWACGVMLSINDERRKKNGPKYNEVKYMLDFGTQKVALTTNDGGQIKNLYGDYEKTTKDEITLTKRKYDEKIFRATGKKVKPEGDETITVTEYFDRLKAFLNDQKLTCKNVAARFTGGFRKATGVVATKKDIYETFLKNNDIDFATLDIEDEATYGSQHTLDIMSPYIREYNTNCQRLQRKVQANKKMLEKLQQNGKWDKADQAQRAKWSKKYRVSTTPRPISKVLILESGSGSIQGMRYELVNPHKRQRRRLKSPLKGIEDLENLLEECREAGYTN